MGPGRYHQRMQILLGELVLVRRTGFVSDKPRACLNRETF